jgi:hypothetical protein
MDLSGTARYMTSQSNNLGVFLCFGVLIINEDHCKSNGAKRASGWQDMQINVSFPLESTHIGYRVQVHDVCLVLSFCTQGDLSKSEHVLG